MDIYLCFIHIDTFFNLGFQSPECQTDLLQFNLDALKHLDMSYLENLSPILTLVKSKNNYFLVLQII